MQRRYAGPLIPTSVAPSLCRGGRQRPGGFTLVELLMASAIVALLATSLAALAAAVRATSQHQLGGGLTLQHGRVAIERIERALNGAAANDQFPGFAVFADRIGSWTFPDTLVVWHPAAVPPAGSRPRINELVVFCYDPATANRLLEIRDPYDGRPAPAWGDTSSWKAELERMKRSARARRAVLTDQLRAAVPLGAAGLKAGAPRGAVRFEISRRPSDQEWEAFRAGKLAWEDMSWVQDIHTSQVGLRQSWCRVELQLRPAHTADNSAEAAIPFFGSGAVYYVLRRGTPAP